jgi:uncharacterized protein
MIQRVIKENILKNLHNGKVVALFGARRTGKTFLMKDIFNSLKEKKILSVTGEDLDVSEILSSRRLSDLQKFVSGYDSLFIDEAHRIPKIGINLKLIVDNIENISVFTTGSSPFDLRNEIGEPLTGRMKHFELFPFTQKELNEDNLKTKTTLEDKLIFGSYPEVITSKDHREKREVLENIKNGYLLKDILSLDNQKDSLFIVNLLRLIAFQIGNDISYSKLATNLGVNKKTVIRYLDLLEKTFVLFSLRGFSRNLRSEYAKTPRYFFWDNGIRNVLISGFNKLNSRDDIGKLWENYCISERIKKINYSRSFRNFYFWRTYDKKEIDLIEEYDGKLRGYEIKWKSSKTKSLKLFHDTYKNSSVKIINNENYLEFIT